MFWFCIKPRDQGFIFCLLFIAHEEIYCALQMLFWISLHFIWKLTIHHCLWKMCWSSGHIPLSPITDVTNSNATACIMTMRGERRLPRCLREMMLLDKNGLYFLMSVTKNGSKIYSRGSGCHNIFFLGKEERRGGEANGKGFILKWAVRVAGWEIIAWSLRYADENLGVESAFTN